MRYAFVQISARRFGRAALRAIFIAMPLALASAGAWAIPTLPTQLGFALDGSGSINSTEFSTQRGGLANAFAALPTDSSVEITVVQFATSAQVEIAPVVIDSVATRDALVADVNAITQTGGSTNPEAAIDLLTSQMTASPSFGGDSIINLSTDGGFGFSQALASAGAAKAAGIDALTAEGIGSGANLDNLLGLVYSPSSNPDDGSAQLLATDASPPNPLTNPAWVVPVSDFAAYGPVVGAKIQAVVPGPGPAPGPVPEPGTLALVAAGFAGLGAFGARARRRVSVAAT